MNREFNTTRIRMNPTPIELAKVTKLLMNYDVITFLYFPLLQLTSFIFIFIFSLSFCFYTTREAGFYICYLKHTTSVYNRRRREHRKKGKPILR